MDIIRLNGEDKKLYELVAPLVMNARVIKANNNYAYKTDADYIWYVAVDGDRVEGFIPLKPTLTGYYMDNYYIHDDEPAVVDILLSTILSEHEGEHLTALVKKRHVVCFGRHGFVSWLDMKNYNKMDFKKNNIKTK